MIGSNQVSNVASSVVTPVALSGFKTPLLNEFEGASAAYSLRRLKSWEDGSKVVRVRRATDNAEQDFSSVDVANGTMANWVNAYTDLPLDVDSGAAAAYSLRNLKASYTGNVVEVRRSSDDAVQSFTADEVADGTLESWVGADALSGFYNNRAYFGAGNSGDYVRLTNVGNFGTQDWQWKLKFFLTDESQFRALIARNDEDPIVGVKANGQLQYYYEDINGNTQNSSLFPDGSINQLVEYTLTLDYDLSAKTMSVTLVGSDGTSLNGTLNNVYHNDGQAAINIGTNSNRTFSTGGSVYDVEIRQSGVLTNSYAGYGNTDADWLDLTGSINGEVFGSPELFTGQGINGHVKTWYDQSGNDNHAVQTDATKQPKIVDAGVLVTRNGDAAIKSTSDNSMTFTLDSLSADGQQSVFGVLENDVTSQDGYGEVLKVFSATAGVVNRRPYWFTDPSGNISLTVDSFTGYLNNDREYRLYSHVMNDAAGGTSTIHRDGTQVDTRSITLDANATFNEGVLLGVTTNATGALYMSEVIYYPSDQTDNRTAIEANIGDYYSIDLPAGVDSGNNEVDGFVTKWYDQSGNGNDAVQTTAAQQPKIVDAGVLVTDRDGKVALNGKGARLKLPSDAPMLSSDGTYSLFAAVDFDDQQNGNDDFNNIFQFEAKTNGGASSQRKPLIFPVQSSGTVRLATPSHPSGIVSLTLLETVGVQLLTNIANPALPTGNNTAYVDGVLVGSADDNTDVSTETLTSANAQIFDNQETTVTHFISEVIYYPSDQSANRTAIEANIADEYGITLS